MKATQINTWPKNLRASEWPEGVLDKMDAAIIIEVLGIRQLANVPMWPSALFDAHIRPEGNSQHSTKGGTRLATATDMHCKTFINLMKVFQVAQMNPSIGGIGLYFDTNTPMIHLDTRPNRIMWVRVDGEYIYAHEDIVGFYTAIAEGVA